MNEIAISVEKVTKGYTIWKDPSARLKHPFLNLAAEIFPGIKNRIDSKLKGLCTDFYAVKDVSFEITRGDSVGIIGRNGSGKSTLLQMIAGTLQPTSGSVTVNGRVAALLELGSGFNPEFTGRENIYLNGAILGLDSKEISEKYDEIVEFSNIGQFIDQPVKTYSSGMLVRLAFAVSICVDPDILIVDEALAVGDAAFQFKCLERLRLLTQKGTTLLFVSHDMGMVKNFCDHVIYLNQGEIKASGAPDEIAEMYFFDLRDEQRRSSDSGSGIISKAFLGKGRGGAFGTEEGYITSAEFTNTKGVFSSYMKGEEIAIKVKARMLPNIDNASISLILKDRRMMEIGGSYFSLEKKYECDGWIHSELIVKWPAMLAAGQYNITVRLETRKSRRNFRPIDKQAGVLTFQVLDVNSEILGCVDLAMKRSRDLKIVALLAIRNEEVYLARCLDHLHQQGIETCIIDNKSTDRSLEIAESYINRGVIRIEHQPYDGYFDLTAQLEMKEKLAREINADWFIHHDADEIREAPAPYKTLKEGIEAVDSAGYNAINFDEFVFIPTSEDENYEKTDYFESMRHYYFYEPAQIRRVNAWKKTESGINIADSGGHICKSKESRIFPKNFILRHYIGLSKVHLEKKYSCRKYAADEVMNKKWHQARNSWGGKKLQLPKRSELKLLSGTLDKNEPSKTHIFRFE
jgi:lipopolysaccharide transport system ATP-binding protein